MRDLTKQQHAAILEAKQQMANIDRLGYSRYEASWRDENGVLLSWQEVEELLSLIPQSKAVTL